MLNPKARAIQSRLNDLSTHINPGPLSLLDEIADRAPDDGASVPLSHYLWILRRRKWPILAFITGAVALVFVISKQITPLYESTVLVDVDRRAPSGIVGDEAIRSTQNDSDQFLATQIKLIQSDSVLRSVADKYQLRLESSKAAAKAPVRLPYLAVSRPPNTYLIAVSYRAGNPQLAADVANGVAKSYIDHTYTLRMTASLGLASFMEKQLDELKAKMDQSTAALAGYEQQMNVINPEEKTSILSARLLQLNTELTNAQADRVRKQAAVRALQTDSPDAALTSPQGEGLRKLIDHQNELREQFAQIQAQYGTNHPEHKQATAKLTEVKHAIENTRASISRRVQIEFREATERENMLSQAVLQAKADFDRLNAHSFKYQQLKRDAEGDKKLYEELVRRIKEAGINATFQNSAIRIADSARPGVEAVFPQTRVNLLLAFLLSTVFAVGIAVVVDVLDDTVKDADDAARSLRTTVVGSLPAVKTWRGRAPRIGSSGDASNPDRAVAAYLESIRTLRSSIFLADFDRNIRSIMVTSAAPSEGKSTTAAQLALAHSQQGKRTLLIDADLRKPSVHRKFDLKPVAGLSTVLEDGIDWRSLLIEPGDQAFLSILPAGPASRRAWEALGSALPHILDDAIGDYDLIIIDAPPLPGFAEPLQMSTAVDGVLVVARAGQTHRKAIGSVLSSLQRVRANLIGLVLNEVTKDLSDSYHYYGTYGKYYSPSA